MPLSNRRLRPSCFCDANCISGTWPFDGYWIEAPRLAGPGYDTPVLYRFALEGSPGVCRWDSVKDHFAGPSVEQLTKATVGSPPGTKAFQWELNIQDATGINVYIIQVQTNLPEVAPIDPNSIISCSTLRWELPHVILGPAFSAVITPAYPDACDDDDYPMKEQRKPWGYLIG